MEFLYTKLKTPIKTHVIYKMSYNNCDKTDIDQTKNQLLTHLKQHKQKRTVSV